MTTITITSSEQAAAIVLEGQVDHAQVLDMQSAIYYRTALAERLEVLSPRPYTQTVADECEWIRDEIEALDADWLEPVSPECEWHLH
jgi:hypothetical protein